MHSTVKIVNQEKEDLVSAGGRGNRVKKTAVTQAQIGCGVRGLGKVHGGRRVSGWGGKRTNRIEYA